MAILELRRHGGCRVVVPRAREAAVAMGFAVDHELVTLATDEGVYAEAERSRWWLGPHPFVALAALIAFYIAFDGRLAAGRK